LADTIKKQQQQNSFLLSSLSLCFFSTYYTRSNLIEANSDKLVVIKFFASFCRACRSLESKLIAVKEDKMLEGLPIVWAEYESTPHNRHVFRDLRVVTLPTIHFYDGKAGT